MKNSMTHVENINTDAFNDEKRLTSALNHIFMDSPVAAKFYGGHFDTFIRNELQSFPEIASVFDSIEIIHPTNLIKLLKVTKNSSKNGKDWGDKIAMILNTLQQLPQLTTEQVLIIRDLCQQRISPLFSNPCLQNMILITSSPRSIHKRCLVFIACKEKMKHQTILLENLELYHTVLPNLVSIKLDQFYINTNNPRKNYTPNQVSHIDIKVPSMLESEVNFFIHIFKCYGKTLQSFRFERETQLIKNIPKDAKDGRDLRKCQADLSQLKKLEINYHSSYTTIILNLLAKSNCELEHLSLIGIPDPQVVLPNLLKIGGNSLKHLTMISRKNINYGELAQFKSLKSLCCHHSTSRELIDVIRILKLLPNLEALDVGFNHNLGLLARHKGIKFEACKLKKLTLHSICLKGSEISYLHSCISHIAHLTLSNCRIGRTENGTEERLSLKDYSLESLTIENCKLYSDSKDPKKLINKFKILLQTNVEYKASIISKRKARTSYEESVSGLHNSFDYISLVNRALEPSQASVLKIYIHALENFKCDESGLKAISFSPVEKDINVVFDPKVKNEVVMDLEPEDTHPTAAMDLEPEDTQPTVAMDLEPEDTQPTVAMGLEPEDTHPTVAMGLEPEDTHPTVAMDIDQHLENIHNKVNVEESEKRNTPESTVQEQNTVHRDSDINKDLESSSGQGGKHRMSAAEFMISDDEDDLIVEKSLYNHLASLSKEANKEKSCIQNKSEEQVKEQTTYEHQNQSDKEEKRIGKRKRSFRDDDDDDDYRPVKERRDSCISEDNASTSEKEEGLFERTLRLRDISPSTDSSHKKQKTHYADLDNSRSKEDDSEQSRNNKLFIKSIRELKPIVYIPIYGKKKKTSIT